MNFSQELRQIDSIFIDTAPIIYYIEAHPQFGDLAKQVIDLCKSGKLNAFSSVITITEVLPKPVQKGEDVLAQTFMESIKYGKHMNLIDISVDIAEKAGRLRGQYINLRALDALQISAALHIKADVFLTNDLKLKQVKEIKIVVLKDYC
ncbi:MAG: PIN domain-containing protein [bacterium]